MADPYDVANLSVGELESAPVTVTRAHLVIVIIDGKPYTATVANIQDAV